MTKLKEIAGYVEMFQKLFLPTRPSDAGQLGQGHRRLRTYPGHPSPFWTSILPAKPRLSLRLRSGVCGRLWIPAARPATTVWPLAAVCSESLASWEDYWKETGSQEVDKGRFDVTHNPADMYVFKVPGIRNVAMTPPYFHDGSVKTLPEAVRIMAKVQLGKTLSDQQTNEIVAFLGSLTGKLPQNFANVPVPLAGGLPQHQPPIPAL